MAQNDYFLRLYAKKSNILAYTFVYVIFFL